MVWDPSTSLPKGPEKEVPAKHTIKAHVDGVLSMALFQAAVDTPDAQPLQLCTTGVLPSKLHCKLKGSCLLYLFVTEVLKSLSTGQTACKQVLQAVCPVS